MTLARPRYVVSRAAAVTEVSQQCASSNPMHAMSDERPGAVHRSPCEVVAGDRHTEVRQELVDMVDAVTVDRLVSVVADCDVGIGTAPSPGCWRTTDPMVLRVSGSMRFDGGVDRPWGTSFAAWLAGVAAFQAALALGAPWGAAAWGGAHSGVLPGRLRAASTAGAVAWVGAATVAAGAVGGETARRRVLRSSTGLAFLSVLLNAASPSRLERAMWVPLTAVGTALGALALRETSRR